MKHPEILDGVHPDLAAVIRLAAERTDIDFGAHEGVRAPERQKQLFASGASRKRYSLHLRQPDGYAHAIDLWCYGPDGKVTWQWEPYKALAAVVLACADELGVPVKWGGNWRRPVDGPHYQIAGTED